jgi:hypothetical protein
MSCCGRGLNSSTKDAWSHALGVATLNRPGFELTPRSWTVTNPPIRRCL